MKFIFVSLTSNNLILHEIFGSIHPSQARPAFNPPALQFRLLHSFSLMLLINSYVYISKPLQNLSIHFIIFLYSHTHTVCLSPLNISLSNMVTRCNGLVDRAFASYAVDPWFEYGDNRCINKAIYH